MSRWRALGGRRTGGWVLGIAAVVAACGAVLPLLGERTGTEVPTYTVEAESFQRRVPAEGNLVAAESTLLSLPASVGQPMRIAWLAEDGTRVAAGDPVVLFDPTDLEKERDDAVDDRTSTDLRAGKQRAERASELEKLERDAELARLKLDNSREFQKKDELIFSRHEIIESEIDEELASEEMEHAVASRGTRESLSDAELELLAIERRKAELSLERAREGLAALEMAAPHDGLVVFRRDWRGDMPRVGQTAYPGNPLAEIPNLAAMEAEVFVLEADAGGLVEGGPAQVVLEAHPDHVFGATVARVDKLAKPRRRGSPVQYFAVTLALEETVPELMKPGQRVRAWLLLDHVEEAVAVPRQAVFERDGASVVYRRHGDGFEAVPVELGPATLGRVVVASGLDAGDVIALADPYRAPEQEEDEDGGGAADGPGGGPLAGAPGSAG
jgi:multidrug efflux pump subunit AcrA (membrane-fusion protein)